HLVADMERLRRHLGIDRWLLYGGSWGSTLILAYAEQHPRAVSEIVISGLTTTRRSEVDWLYRGAGRFFPEQWERFPRDGDVVGAYARLMEHPDTAVRETAAADWCDSTGRTRSCPARRGAPAPRAGTGRPPPAARRALVRVAGGGCAPARRGPAGGIPGVLVHGRLDMAGPLGTAWELARAWPGAELVVVEDAGHLGGAATRDHVLAAPDRHAATA
ncbi:alpha/beta fold hydrolase, partial [Streptomyces sp. SID7760]|nr:alpha/beta fold hydrolase [Streptomyces sp. SID7760]